MTEGSLRFLSSVKSMLLTIKNNVSNKLNVPKCSLDRLIYSITSECRVKNITMTAIIVLYNNSETTGKQEMIHPVTNRKHSIQRCMTTGQGTHYEICIHEDIIL